MINCPFCGVELSDDTKFCTACGTKIESAAPTAEAVETEEAVVGAVAEGTAPEAVITENPVAEPVAPVVNETYIEPAPAPIPAPIPMPVPMPASAPTSANEAKDGEKPMSVGGWILTFILLCLPIIDIILTIVWACGKSKYKSKVTFARALLIVLLAAAILTAIGIIVLLILFRNDIDKIVEIFKDFISSLQTI